MFHPLIFVKKLPSSPIFNLLSLSIILIGALSIFAGAFFDLSLSMQSFLATLDRFILAFFLIESALRMARTPSVKDYLTDSLFWIDLFSLLPPAVILLIQPEQPVPGDLILRGGRLLRLIPIYQFFSQERSMGLRAAGSRLEYGLLSSAALLMYLFLLSGGVAMSVIHHRLSDEERFSRLLRIKRYMDTQGLQGIQDLFRDRILKVEKRTPGESYEVYLIDRTYIQTHMRSEKDFLYVEGPTPEEAVLVSFFDLNRRQLQFEASLLATGLLMIGALAILLHRYFRDHILLPVERASRVMELRILGEEIESCEIPGRLDNEITRLIEKMDRFYLAMREPRDPVRNAERPGSEPRPS
jgi:hypothetical protein